MMWLMVLGCVESIEVCDGIDNDGDGEVDEGLLATFYADADSDGFGNSASALTACIQPGGAVTDDGDCDDEDPAVNPAAAEVCNDIDDDCNAAIDDEPTDGEVFYADADADGFGNAEAPVISCQPEAGSVADDTDCDDGDNTIFPGAWELCDDGIDHDCDGSDRACTASVSDLATTTFIGEVAGDKAGYWAQGGGDVNADGVPDLVLGASKQSDGADSGGASYLIYGLPDVGTVSLYRADAKFTAESAQDDAFRIIIASDLDGSGGDDIAIGARYDDDGGNNSGALYFIYGPVTGELGLGAADVKLIGSGSENTGHWLASVPDADDPDHAAVLTGAWTRNSYQGAAYLVQGPLTGSAEIADVATLSLIGETTYDNAGYYLSALDLLGNGGLDELLISARYENTAGEDAGALYVVDPAGRSGEVGLADADARILGEEAEDHVGITAQSPGDSNGDGYQDILIGTGAQDAGGSNSGAAYLITSLGGSDLSGHGDLDLSDADAKIIGETAGDEAGSVVSFAGDVDGDGRDDLLISADAADIGNTDAGAVYLLLGPVSSNVELSLADARIIGEASGDRLKWAAAAGDLDRDGLGDILIGAPDADFGEEDVGVAYLILGSAL
jgi:hypothetical protein